MRAQEVAKAPLRSPGATDHVAGVPSTGPTAARGAPLTPREREIAELAATGLTSRQIAARIFLSHRTVGAHLYRAFPKLGITTRAGLRDALSTTSEPAYADVCSMTCPPTTS